MSRSKRRLLLESLENRELFALTVGAPEKFVAPLPPDIPAVQPTEAKQLTTAPTASAPSAAAPTGPLLAPDPNAIFVTSADWQGKPAVTVYNADGSLRYALKPYKKSFVGGLRVAVGDVNGDGLPDIITAPGPGKQHPIKVYNGPDGDLIDKFKVGSKSFSGGFYVAAGNFDADVSDEVVVAMGNGGNSSVRVFNVDGSTATAFPGVLGHFNPYGASFNGGVQVAAANIDGLGTDELIVAPGYGGNSLVKVYSADGTLVSSFTAYTSPFTGGLFVAAGDLDGDGDAEIVTGPAQTNLSLVRVFDGTTGAMLVESYVYGQTFRGGVRVAIADRNQDGIPEIATSPGILGDQNVLFLDATTLATVDNFFAGYPGPRKVRGVFIAASRLP